MTVLSGGLSGGHLWDLVDVRPGPHGGTVKTFVPMLPMTAEDLGGYTDELFGAVWPDPFPRPCIKCDTPGACFGRGQCLSPDF